MSVREKTKSYILVVRGKNYVVRKRIARFVIEFDRKTLFPLYAGSYDEEGDLIEEVFFQKVRVGVEFGRDFFDLKGR